MIPRFFTLSSIECEPCQFEKYGSVSFTKHPNTIMNLLTLVLDFLSYSYNSEFQYFVAFIDDYS